MKDIIGKYKYKDSQQGDQPGGIVVKSPYSTLVAWASWVQIPGADLHTAGEAMLWRCSAYKIEEDWQRCQISDNLPHQKYK